jgi:predicted  nucleic acid-binding Zn-ribbon protein
MTTNEPIYFFISVISLATTIILASWLYDARARASKAEQRLAEIQDANARKAIEQEIERAKQNRKMIAENTK